MILKHFLDYSFNPYSLIFFVAAIVGVYVAFRVIQQRNKSCVVNLFILLLILSILSNIALFFQSNSLSAKNFEFWGFINLTVSVFAAPIFLFFALMFIGKIAFVRNIVFFLLALLPPLIFLFLYWQTDLFISHNFNYAQLAPWGYVPLEGPLEMVGSLFFAIYFCLGYSLIIFHYFKEKNKKNRQPLKIMVIALFVPTLFIPLFQVILPHFLGFPSFPASSVFVMIMSIIIGYALSKYKLSIFNLVDIAPELIESIPTSFLVLDEDKNIRFVSSPAEKFLGYGTGEIIGKNFYNFIKKESRAIYEKETLKILEHEKEVEIENLEILGREKALPVNISVGLFRGTGTAPYSILFLSSIAKLKEERDRSNTIISSMAEGLLVMDRDCRVITANPAAFQLLGAKKLLGKNVLESIFYFEGGKKNSHEKQLIRDVFEEGKTVLVGTEDDLFYQNIVGKKFPIVASFAPTIADGKVTGAVMVFRDITAEKEVEEMKSNFIATASHQLRTPLTSMRWFSEMVLSGDAGKISKKQKHFINRVYHGTERMIKLIGFLLKLVRVEAKKIKISPKPRDLKEVVEKVIQSFDDSIVRHSLHVSLHCNPESLPEINLDEEIFKEVMENLISNAITYSFDGKNIKIAIIKKGENIEISVKDEGIGIPLKEQAKIFEKFFRTDPATALAPDGWGLGLTLSKHLVEEWGGRIWFISQEGKGTTFYFTIPVSGMKEVEGWVDLAT